MKTLSQTAIKLVLISALAAPFALFAAEKAAADHANHHPAEVRSAGTAASVAPRSVAQLHEQMQVRMRAMQQVTDPQARAAIMAVQMQDMQEMMQGAGVGCPMAGHKGMKMGMMGGDMMNSDKHGPQGMHGNAVK